MARAIRLLSGALLALSAASIATVLFAPALLSGRAQAAGATSVTRSYQAPLTTDTAYRDSYVNSFTPTTNNGTGTTMNVKSSSTTSCASNTLARSCSRSLIWFDVSNIPGGSTISAASVDLNATTAGASARTHGLHPVTASWTEAGVTWNTRDGATAWTTAGGDFNATASQTVSTGTTTGVKTFADVAALRSDVSGWVNTSANNLGWLVKDQSEITSTSVTWTYGAKDNATLSNRPKLTVTFTAPWDSYNDSARTAQDDLFQTGENIVYMRGTGFGIAGLYVIGYYDGNGDKRCTEAVAAVSGTLDSQCSFLGAAASGTWHAVVFEPGITAVLTYSGIVQSTDKVVADDTFTVEAGAVVPELPSVLAAASVTLASAAIYLWFSRRPREVYETVYSGEHFPLILSPSKDEPLWFDGSRNLCHAERSEASPPTTRPFAFAQGDKIQGSGTQLTTSGSRACGIPQAREQAREEILP